MRIGGIVLCGGEGRRLGRPKAWLTIGEEHFLQRAVRILQQIANPVLAAGRVGQNLPPLPEGVEIVRDVIEDAGPLSGMAAGFAALRESCEVAVVITCDHPLLKPEFLRRLVDMLGNHSGIVPVYDGQTYPLLGVYRLDTQSVLMDMLREGSPFGAADPIRKRKRPVDAPRGGAWGSERHDDGARAGRSERTGRSEHGREVGPTLSVRGFVSRCGAWEVAAEELREVDPNLESLINVNDWETYQRLVGDR